LVFAQGFGTRGHGAPLDTNDSAETGALEIPELEPGYPAERDVQGAIIEQTVQLGAAQVGAAKGLIPSRVTNPYLSGPRRADPLRGRRDRYLTEGLSGGSLPYAK